MNKKLLMILCSGVFVFGFALKGMEGKADVPIDDEAAATGENIGEVDKGGEVVEEDATVIKNLPLIVSVIINPKTGEIVDIEGVKLPDDAMHKLISSNPDAANLWRIISRETGFKAWTLDISDLETMPLSKALNIFGHNALKTLEGFVKVTFIVVGRLIIPLGKKVMPYVIKISKDTAGYLKLWALWSYRNGIQPGAHFIARRTPEAVTQFFNKYWGEIKNKSVKVWKNIAFQFN